MKYPIKNEAIKIAEVCPTCSDDPNKRELIHDLGYLWRSCVTCGACYPATAVDIAGTLPEVDKKARSTLTE